MGGILAPETHTLPGLGREGLVPGAQKVCTDPAGSDRPGMAGMAGGKPRNCGETESLGLLRGLQRKRLTLRTGRSDVG